MADLNRSGELFERILSILESGNGNPAWLRVLGASAGCECWVRVLGASARCELRPGWGNGALLVGS